MAQTAKNMPAMWETQVRSLGQEDPLATLWTVTRQAPLSMGFSRQEYWSGLSFPPPGDFSDPGTEPISPVAPALHVDLTSLAPHERLPEILVVPREKTPTGAAARGNP